MSDKKTSWGEFTEWYDELVKSDDSYQNRLILPNLVRLVSPGADDSILDIGCGQGLIAIAFAGIGAKVFACDVSSELVATGKKNDAHGLVNWRVASASNLNFAKIDQFNKLTAILSLQNIEDLNAALSEAARVCAPGGTLHIVLNHPCFRIPRKSEWRYEEASKTQARLLSGYMSNSESRILMHPGLNSASTISFHRPLQVYIKALSKNGFAITGLEEWISDKVSDAGPRKEAEDRARKEFPLFLYIRAEKLLK